MTDLNACDWLMENGGATVRYTVARELLKASPRNLEPLEAALLECAHVKKWLGDLIFKPPHQLHGSFDYNFENAMLKLIQLGLHAGIGALDKAATPYVALFEDAPARSGPARDKTRFDSILSSNLLSAAGFESAAVQSFMLKSLDELHAFAAHGLYDLYVPESRRASYKGLPAIWKSRPIIDPALFDSSGFAFPLVYDLIGLYRLYGLGDESIGRKIDDVIRYIACDAFHETIADGYGVLVSGPRRYLSMGWDPKFPGWHDVARFAEQNPGHMPRLLFFALHAAQYPPAADTRWLREVLALLEDRRAQGVYCFPKPWLKEKPGYAVMGAHVSFGEDRNKKNWHEIESTLYMQLLKKRL